MILFFTSSRLRFLAVAKEKRVAARPEYLPGATTDQKGRLGAWSSVVVSYVVSFRHVQTGSGWR
jgi:hypothetical protein